MQGSAACGKILAAFSHVIGRFLWNDTQQAKHSPSCNTACMQGSAACGKILAAVIERKDDKIFAAEIQK